MVINSNVSLEPKFQVTLDHSNLHIQLCAQLLTSKSGIVFLGHKKCLIEKSIFLIPFTFIITSFHRNIDFTSFRFMYINISSSLIQKSSRQKTILEKQNLIFSAAASILRSMVLLSDWRLSKSHYHSREVRRVQYQ